MQIKFLITKYLEFCYLENYLISKTQVHLLSETSLAISVNSSKQASVILVVLPVTFSSFGEIRQGSG